MDANANSEPLKPKPHPSAHDLAHAGPIDPTTGQPDHAAEVTELKSWLRQNALSLVITAIVVVVVGLWLDPWGAFLVVVGLGLVIFIHELGHFLAAKWCDVHVKTFSIGFGPAVPFCSYKWGETTYMIGIIPLGGYVQMVGEGESGDSDDDGEEDPRSFKKKSVGQRMLIISAGVIMNVVLGMVCFVAAYLHGVQEIPAVVGRVESGGAAWRVGIQSDDEIVDINGRKEPGFKDIPPAVMTTHQGETIPVQVRRNGQLLEPMQVEPLRDEGQLFPQLGVGSPSRLVLASFGKRPIRPVVPGTPAAAITDGPTFEPGDQIIAMSDPQAGGTITPVTEFADYYRRLVRLAGQPVTFEVLRKGETDPQRKVAITVSPAYRHSLGMRMRMGEIVAIRERGPAAAAGLVPRSENPAREGDRIKAVLLPPDANGLRRWYVNGSIFTEDKEKTQQLKPEFQLPGLDIDTVKTTVRQEPLDPLLLPHQIHQWVDQQPADATLTVDVVVLREENHTQVPKRIPITYDRAYRYSREYPTLPNSPLSISGWGLAYWVEAIIDDVTPNGPAAQAKTAAGELPTGLWARLKRTLGFASHEVSPGGEPRPLQSGDVITAVRFKAKDAAGNWKIGDWKEDLKVKQWASADTAFQASGYEIDLRIDRKGEIFTVTLQGQPDTAFPDPDRGLVLETDTRLRQASDIGDALSLGVRSTVRFIKTVYMNLYGLIFGRVSVKTMSGPITIATTTYRLAEEDIWKLLLFLGMISVNLAVVNFLPIPVLDGGHMVFLILEKILGRPVPERVFAVAMYLGLFLILGLMVLTITNDVRREFFGL
ncbi:MAG: RIP metalloprotease RseP [Gemmataceae bacterium]|nr:RIP metalloprotease RseP [Gemmata sp.]MDW8198010.1 RIP metalloprotease RseP [Gemmataceae bacterium]